MFLSFRVRAMRLISKCETSLFSRCGNSLYTAVGASAARSFILSFP